MVNSLDPGGPRQPAIESKRPPKMGPDRSDHLSMIPDPSGQSGRQIASSRFPDDPEMAALAEMFLEQLEIRITELRQACHRGDLDSVRFGTHQLRGAAGGYGFPEIGLAAGAIEDMIRSGANEASSFESELSRRLEGLESVLRSIAAA